jgi:perosamine synthetase
MSGMTMVGEVLAPHGSPRLGTTQYYFQKGRAALCALLRALKVGPSDEIIVPVYTCPAVLEPVLGLGSRAVYCDIERTTFGLSPQASEAALTERTKAVIIQHTFGVPARLNELMRAVRDRGVAILEDCCHVSSSFYWGKRLGCFGDAAFYSHDWDKPLSAGGGGVAVVNSISLAKDVQKSYSELSATSVREEARIIGAHAFVSIKKMARAHLPHLVSRWHSRTRAETNGDRRLVLDRGLGPEYARRIARSSEYRLRKVLKNPELRIAARKRAIERYESGFRSLGIECFQSPAHCDVVLWRYPLFAQDKPRVLEEARRCGASLADWGTIPLRFLANGGSESSWHPGSFPIAEEIARHVVTVTVREKQDDGDVDRTLGFLSRMKQRGLI